MADTNGDGELSTPEATNLANFLIGGFFFRADTNNDGTVTPEEGREARGEFVQEYPAAARLLMRASSATGAAPFTKLAEVIDPAYGKPLTIAEARSAAQSAVADLFSFADANHDKKLTTAELQSAAVDGLKAAAKEAFQAADANHDGSIDESEFEAALKPSEKIAFALADTNADGKLTEAEASKAMSALASRMSAVGSLQIP
ncbi:MAG: EF-hand domain-containing protein [Byssovorax sp.]